MDVQEFEQAILKLAFETDARITTASVAYFLGIPSSKANELLNALLDEGVLELDSDQEGNLFYRVANQPEHSREMLPRLRQESESDIDAELEKELSNQGEREDHPGGLSPSVMLVSPHDDADVEPISPRSGPEGAEGDTGGSPSDDLAPLAGRRDELKPSASAETASDTEGPMRWKAPVAGEGGSSDGRSVFGPAVDRGGHSSGSNQLFSGLTQRQAQPDASLDTCGASSVIVSDSVRCDPKPLPSRKPVVASCVDESSKPQAQWAEPREQSSGELFERAQSQSTMLAPTAGGELALRQDQLERPEHQPGMALLLSLILCGTGQIYNGEVSKGIMMMVLCFLLWFVLLGWVVHIWSIVDSVVVAERLNRKAG